MKRGAPLKRNSPLAPARRKTRPKVPEAVRRTVKLRTAGLCHLCLYRLGYAIPVEDGAATGAVVRVRERRGARRIAHLHHVFPVELFPELRAEPANIIGACVDCHFGHEQWAGHGAARITREALLPETLELAAGDGPRTVYLERAYPLTDAGADPRPTQEVYPHG